MISAKQERPQCYHHPVHEERPPFEPPKYGSQPVILDYIFEWKFFFSCMHGNWYKSPNLKDIFDTDDSLKAFKHVRRTGPGPISKELFAYLKSKISPGILSNFSHCRTPAQLISSIRD